jgi:voltage-gated potassium channel
MKNSSFINEFHVLIEVFMIVLALFSGALLLVVLFAPVTSLQLARIEQIDITISFIFLTEFIIRFVTARSKRDFLRKSWWELLAAIPVSNEITEALRLLRLLRIGRLLLHIEFIREKRTSRRT